MFKLDVHRSRDHGHVSNITKASCSSFIHNVLNKFVARMLVTKLRLVSTKQYSNAATAKRIEIIEIISTPGADDANRNFLNLKVH